MRIALDMRCCFRGMGGIGRYAWSLLKEYAALDRENEYVCYLTHLGPPERLSLPRSFKVRSYECGMIDDRFDVEFLPEILLRDEIDVYHNATFSVPDRVKSAVRTVATVHDVVFKRRPELVPAKLGEYLDRATRRTLSNADAVVTVSDFSRAEIREAYEDPRPGITVIPNGVHPPSGDANDVDDLWALGQCGLRSNRYVLYVGSVEPKKNIDLLLSGFREALDWEDGRDFDLAIAGARGMDLYPLDDRLRTLGIEDRVRVLGYVPEILLEVLYRHARAFVYPSLYEGFGLPPLEAMLRGVPTIVSRASSLPEVVGEAALLVDPEDSRELGSSISLVLDDDDLWRDLSLRGRERAREFSWRRSAEAHLELFRKVMESDENRPSGV